ncbi:hypothetical protein OIO90_004232 [Microbotryomycetes sp. JL221]|nr:hypothetical protein OIO90_004232 [Microbotryomycetes sp. JL221]
MSTLWSTSELSYARVPLSSSTNTEDSAQTDAFRRTDGRPRLCYRDVQLRTSTSNAQGAVASCIVSVDGSNVDQGGLTTVEAGVRAEVEPIHGDDDDVDDNDAGKIIVSIDCAPAALDSIKPERLAHLSSLLTSLFSPTSLPPSFLRQLVVIPQTKAWTLYLDVLISSSFGGNVTDLCLLAARSALACVRLPMTRPVGFDPDQTEGTGVANAMDQDQGFSGLVKGGKAGSKAVDFELLETGTVGGGVQRLKGWDKLPIGVTLSLINQLPFLDATALEEAAASSQLMCCFTSTGDLCGMRQTGEGEIEFVRLSPLLKEARRIATEMLTVTNKKLQHA